jgi:hypothetical protein
MRILRILALKMKILTKNENFINFNDFLIYFFPNTGSENIFKENVFYIIFDLYEKSNPKPIIENIKLTSNDNSSLIKILNTHQNNQINNNEKIKKLKF